MCKCVIITPISSGKTGVAQLAIQQALEAVQRVIYVVPMQSLVSEKGKNFADLSSVAGEDARPKRALSHRIPFSFGYRAGMICSF